MLQSARNHPVDGQVLLERDWELELIGRALADPGAGVRALVFEGPAGIGKTALLDVTCAQGEEHGRLVLRARGGELERDFPHGVVRQLFEEHLHRRPAEERRALLRGAAALATAVVSPAEATAAESSASESPFTIAHGLYWLTSNLAECGPLLIAVDDVQWSDAASLRFIVHLVRRLEGMPVLVVACVRSGEPQAASEFLEELRSQPHTRVLRPAPLTEGGVADLVARRLGEVPDAEFVTACWRATGGTPFLVRELLEDLGSRAVRPTREAAPGVLGLAPETVARAVLHRLERLPAAASRLARAVAVLGADGRLERAARLSGLQPEDAVVAADALMAMQILRPGRPLEFVHPIIRNAIYDALPVATRAQEHRRAAELLADEEAGDDAVAAHLLLCEPAAWRETVERLRAAAAGAVARGAFESAAVFLRRALDEGGCSADERARVLLELARALRPVRSSSAIECLRNAHQVAQDRDLRARIAYDLAETAFYSHPRRSVEVVEEALAEADGIDPELAGRLEILAIVHDWHLQRLEAFEARLPRARSLACADTPVGRSMALHLAGARVFYIEPPGEVERLLDLGARGRRIIGDAGPETRLLTPLFEALLRNEHVDEALELSEALIAETRRRGSIVGFGNCVLARSWVHGWRGDLAEAEVDARTGLEIAREHGFNVLERQTIDFVFDAIVERPQLGDEATRLLALELDRSKMLPTAWLVGLKTRAHLRLALGEVEGGIADMRELARDPGARGNPNAWPTRLPLALTLAPTDRAEALRLVHSHLKLAHVVAQPRAMGMGLRTLGLIEGGAPGLALLEEAVRVLERTPARLERARALVELGAARRRSNDRAAAREPLRAGLDLAHRCGATRLEERARTELAATGARPRRVVLSGWDALTASERRVAEMAAAGLSNPQIAQALFVTRKTVENHLGHIFGKLGINSRAQLAEFADGAGRQTVTPV